MNKVVNYFVAAAVSLASVSAIAATQCGNLSGMYAGANFGYGMGSGKLAISDQTNAPAATADLGTKGVRGGFHFGYGKLFPNKAYLGFEGSADLSNTTGKNFDSFRSKRRDSFGVALRMGGVMGAGMLTYAKVGVDTAKWKSTAYNNFAAPGVAAQIGTGSQNKRLTGLVLGLGMETMVAEHVMVGGEWAYTTYSGSSNVKVLSPIVGDNSFENFNFKPRTSDFRLRVSYKW